MGNKFDRIIEHIINENHSAARKLFHNVVVEKSRKIYEELEHEDAVDEVEREQVFNVGGDEVDDFEDDVVDHNVDQPMAGDEDGLYADDDDEMAEDDDFDADDEFDSDDDTNEFGAEDDLGVADDDSVDDAEDRIVDLEDSLAELQNEFEKLISKDNDDEDDDEDFDDEDFDDEAEEDEESLDDEAEEDEESLDDEAEEDEESLDDEAEEDEESLDDEAEEDEESLDENINLIPVSRPGRGESEGTWKRSTVNFNSGSQVVKDVTPRNLNQGSKRGGEMGRSTPSYKELKVNGSSDFKNRPSLKKNELNQLSSSLVSRAEITGTNKKAVIESKGKRSNKKK